MREWVAREYKIDPDWVEESMTMAQIALRYYLGHKDELNRMKSETNMLATVLMPMLKGAVPGG